MITSLLAFTDWLRFSALSRKELKSYALGARAEDLAHRYLSRRGFQVVARNFRTRDGHGEIDLVAWENGKTLVFVEVKSRQGEEHGAPGRNVSPDKKRTLLRAGREYARRADIPFDQARFDLVSVVFEPETRIWHERDMMST